MQARTGLLRFVCGGCKKVGYEYLEEPQGMGRERNNPAVGGMGWCRQKSAVSAAK